MISRFDGIDSNGKRSNQRLNKPILPNHRIFDPIKEKITIILFIFICPIWNKSNLVKNFHTAEEAFNHFITSRGDICTSTVKVCRRCLMHNQEL